VYRTIKGFQTTGNHADTQRPGRPRSSTVRDDRLLIRQSLRNRPDTVPSLRISWRRHGIHVSNTTTRRRLQAAGLFGRVATRKPLLTATHRFTLFPTDGRVFVRRRTAEALRDDCVAPTVKFGGGGMTVWGAMSYRGTGCLQPLKGNLNAQGYIGILEMSAIPSAHLLGYGDNYFFQDDGAPCHRARVVATRKADNNIRCLDWPPQSPDLNPIEHLWMELGVSVHQYQCRNLRDLERSLQQAWDLIPVQKCRKLVRSMPARIQAGIAARGG
jgi:hypothetical protein